MKYLKFYKSFESNIPFNENDLGEIISSHHSTVYNLLSDSSVIVKRANSGYEMELQNQIEIFKRKFLTL